MVQGIRLLIVLGLWLGLWALISTTASAQDIPYILGPGDEIAISVWRDETLTRDVVVSPDGLISYPLLGTIDTRGLTIGDLQGIFTERLAAYVPDTPVTVLLLRANSMRAYVIGKVEKPGQFPITMETTVTQLLSMAGGLNAFAAPGKIFILRRVDGVETRIPFNYDQMRRGGAQQRDLPLERGDVVVVP